MAILALDVGTTNMKAGLVDLRGKVLAQVQAPVPMHVPEPGAAEHDAEEIFGLAASLCRKLALRGPVDGLVFSTYNLGLLGLDQRLKPIGGLITLADTRSHAAFPAFRKAAGDLPLYRLTGSPAFPHTPLAKAWWLKTRRPAYFKKARFWVSLKDYLLYRLTACLCSEPSLASATQFLDIRKLAWCGQVLRTLGLEASSLPNLVPSDRALAPLAGPAARALGLAAGLPVIPGVYDGAAGGLGLGILGREGCGVVNLGTTAMLRVAAPKPVWDPRQRIQAYYLAAGRWFIGGGANNAGSALQWLARDFFNEKIEALCSLAAAVPAGSSGLSLLPFLTGERSRQAGENAAGLLAGLRAGHGRGHVFRAAMEGVACMLRTFQEAAEGGGVRVRSLLAGGGAQSPAWSVILAGVLGRPLEVSPSAHPSLVGSAMVAYTALGAYPDLQAATKAMVPRPIRVPPKAADRPAYEQAYARFAHLLDANRGFQEAGHS